MTTRNRRLRKKLYLDEFAVYGFEVTAECQAGNSNNFEQFIDDFIDMIEGRDLLFSGGGDLERFDVFVVAQTRYGSPSEEDRQAVEDWLKERCTEAKAGDFVDVFYGDFD
ncbi:YggL family protein [Thiomicrorhabdus sp. 6S2-11]|uniref:YggL family protein n=1 Tax=Thiomicrorhabdus marina TaxID=2818442 RepID=A0ABS3Q5S1_9GAMM|nr:50S ribosome-binding protein YggL [Thiomicrorhabdus marina]MBO1927672.1 YggL family protein [Thiomicrorhabdus marina]